MTELHWFNGKQDCEDFFTRMAKNNKTELTPNFVFEGNSGTTYQWIIDVANMMGWANIGITKRNYEDADIDFLDEVFLCGNRNRDVFWDDDGNRIWLEADEVSIESSGFIRVWWD